MRKSETVATVFCVASIMIGAYVIFLGLWHEESWIPLLTASGVADVVVGAIGFVLVLRLAMTRNPETTPKLIALCVAVILVVISGPIWYLTHLRFGTT